MIAKHIPMKTPRKSSISSLISYITSTHGKSERVGMVRISNCQAAALQAATAEILATQQCNTRAVSDKTFHLIVSFRAGENPDTQTLAAIEDRICTGLGYAGHQRVSAVHHDTDNLHIHIAINKVCPSAYTLHDPFRSYKTLGQLCKTLETEFGLEQDNHRVRRTLSENRAADMEHHSGIETLVTWIRRECLADLTAAPAWNELHKIMRKNGLEIYRRGNGLVIASGEITVKASTVSRDLSMMNLEKRLGAFESEADAPSDEKEQRCYTKQPLSRINTSELYARYRQEQRQKSFIKRELLITGKQRRDQEIATVRQSDKLRRAAIKLMKGGRVVKKLLYAQANQTLRSNLKTVHTRYRNDCTYLHEKYRRGTWADWLKHQAQQGDQQALSALRARENAAQLKGDTIKGDGVRGVKNAEKIQLRPDSVTKTGKIIYRPATGTGAVRDDGERFQVSRQSDSQVVQEALRLAVARYGRCITVTGSPLFKAQVIQAAVSMELPVTFADPGLERRRQAMVNMNSKGNNYEYRSQQRSGGTDRGRPDRCSSGRYGSTAARYTGTGKDRQSGAKPDNQVRRNIYRPVTGAVANYIAERESKRSSGVSDIPKHRPYNEYAGGGVVYAGTRTVDGQPLVLLKAGAEIFVHPVDQATARRLKTVSVGDPVTVTAAGSVKSVRKGRVR